jgi:CBS domain-containing protein
MLARDVMQRDPLTVLADTPLLAVQHLCVVANISGVPVVDETGGVLGVVSRADLLRAVDAAYDEDVDESPSPGGAERLDLLTALDVASPDVVWVSPTAPIAEVARIMHASGIHRVLVGEDGHLAGILTTFDVLKAVETSAD